MSEDEPNSTVDHSPKTAQETAFFTKADKVYAFMEKIYAGYGRMRFRGAPFMLEPEEELQRRGQESISGHMRSATLFFRVMLPILPNISLSIDKHLAKEFIEIHDLGEIKNGDISAVLQLQGHGKNRGKREWNDYTSLISILPDEARLDLMNQIVYEKEKADGKTKNKEALLAKIFDMIQGDHYVLTHSINFQDYGDLHRQIVSSKLIPYVKRLEEVYLEENNTAAALEARLLIQHHLYQYQSKGVLIP